MKNRKSRYIAVFTAMCMIFSMFMAPITSVYANSDTKTTWSDGVTGGAIYFDKSTGEIVGCDESVTTVIIPDAIEGVKVTGIGENALRRRPWLESVTIPNSVIGIGELAFLGCERLTSVTIPNSVTSIGEYAFSDCLSLESVTIPSDITTIENGTFNNCSSLKSITIPNNVTNIGNTAFSGCTSLESMTIPNSVTSIGEYAFSDCLSLESVTIPSSVTSIGVGTFNNCSSLESITIPSNVTSIGSSAFSSCLSLTSITIPSSITTIEEDTFSNCSSLESITIPSSITSIGNRTFQGCVKLKSITIPNSVTSIGVAAFMSCKSLESIRIPSSITTIEGDTFNGCKSLTSVTIPSSVTSIGIGAFSSCDSLTSVTIPKGVTTIETLAFYYCTSLEKIIIPSSVTEIGPSAFANCLYLTIYGYLDSYAEKYAFDKNITFISISDDEPAYSDWFDGVTGGAIYFDKTTGKIVDCDKSVTAVVIPEEIEGAKITGIGPNAFELCMSLSSITIPKSITSIGAGAFRECESLTSVFYTGNMNEWNSIKISDGNLPLEKAEKHFTGHNHVWSGKWVIDKKPTCTKKGSKHRNCTSCDAVDIAEIPTVTHDYKDKITVAKLDKDGKIEKKCSECGEVKSTTPIYRPTKFSLSKTEYTYDGKTHTPTVTVKDSKGNTLKKDTDYTVSYSTERKYVGEYTAKITFKGKYSGTKSLYYTIDPVKTSLTSVKAEKKGFTAKWSKKSTQVTGYQIQYSTSSKFSSSKTVTVSKYSTTSAKISKLSAKKKYYVRVRTYKTVGKEKYYSDWSSAKSITTKS